MDRRELFGKLFGVGLLPFIGCDQTVPAKKPVEKSRPCRYCGKPYGFAQSQLFDTSAQTPEEQFRTYAVAGAIYYHLDGTRCSVEHIKYEKLDSPIVHKNIRVLTDEEYSAKRRLEG